MTKSVILGTLSGIAAVIVVGVLLGLAVAPDDPQVSFAKQHNRLIREWHVQLLILIGWTAAAMIGGFVAARRHRPNWARASLLVGIALVVLWGLPSLFIAGAGVSLTHMLAVALVVPGSLSGGFLAGARTPSNPTVETDARKDRARGSP